MMMAVLRILHIRLSRRLMSHLGHSLPIGPPVPFGSLGIKLPIFGMGGQAWMRT